MNKTILILVSGFLLWSCTKEQEPANETFAVAENGTQITLTEVQKKNAGIQTTSINNQNIANKIVLNGQIDVPPQNMAQVSSSTGGIVKNVRFMPGQYVSKGHTLAIIENPDLAALQQDYLQAKANLGYAQKDYERQKYLNKYQASADKVVQRAHSEAQNQEAAVRGLASRLSSYGINASQINTGNIQKSTALIAPISGYISKVNIAQGQFVSSAEILYEIMNSNQIHVALKVFEKDLSLLSIGQKVYAYTNQNPEKKYPATVAIIGKDFTMDRSVLVHCELLEKDPSLIPGTFMNAEIEVNAQEDFVIPESAVVTWENKQYIFEEIRPNTYKMFPVTIGNTENGYTELLNFDLKNVRKKFVTKGAYALLMALKNVEE
ncbi:efflux RND transporter periplasmic adaptor subunit [Bergeyella sp. RCAD1439]|uniref:efflux RND transporter periplasmic adaptor subunit n=1 Tax=Bergeyella anatis TaxID=3113737 RepID=UPI002E180059|nr:efflux RND transporter periplasmic adaptor subunit [Bergeyella sp. RCAD1439]